MLLELQNRVSVLEEKRPHATSVTGEVYVETTSIPYVDMPAYYVPLPAPGHWVNMTVTVNVQRESELLIMFSALSAPSASGSCYVHALVNGVEAEPSGDCLLTAGGIIAACACNFVYYVWTPGTYTVKIQWKVMGDWTGVSHRTLIVLTIPT
jgi:hypothetical protein